MFLTYDRKLNISLLKTKIMINKVTLVGHVGQDPEVRKLENGTPVGRFSLATNESYKDANGEMKDLTEWHNIVVWRNLAEIAEKILKKGSLVYVEGKISYRKFTDKNGVEKTATDIVASNFRNMTKKEGTGGGSNFPSTEPTSMVGNNSNSSNFEVVTPTGDAPEPQAGDDLPF
jgi:single-strand DNA-binding protein